MVINPKEFEFIIFGDDKQTFDLIYRFNKISYNQEDKVAGITISNELSCRLHEKKTNKEC